MKKLFFILLLNCLIAMGLQAQNDKPMQLASSSIANKDAKFLLFPTQNFHIFLKLNTCTGEVYMVQFSLEGNELEKKIFSIDYPFAIEEEQSNGRFFLYPTTNIYNFLLLDQIDGRVWQVQWNFDDSKCFITRIYSDKKGLYDNMKVLLNSLDYRDNIYYILDEMYNGIAYLDKEYTIGQLLTDGRIRYKDLYSAYHNTGELAFIFRNGGYDNIQIYHDEEGKIISKELFMEIYSDLLERVKMVMSSLNQTDKTP